MYLGMVLSVPLGTILLTLSVVLCMVYQVDLRR